MVTGPLNKLVHLVFTRLLPRSLASQARPAQCKWSLCAIFGCLKEGHLRPDTKAAWALSMQAHEGTQSWSQKRLKPLPVLLLAGSERSSETRRGWSENVGDFEGAPPGEGERHERGAALHALRGCRAGRGKKGGGSWHCIIPKRRGLKAGALMLRSQSKLARQTRRFSESLPETLSIEACFLRSAARRFARILSSEHDNA